MDAEGGAQGFLHGCGGFGKQTWCVGELGDQVGVGGRGVLGGEGVELGLEGGGFVVQLGEAFADATTVGGAG